MKPVFLTIAALLVAACAAFSQNEGSADPLAKHLLPPAFIFSKAGEIDLSSEQRGKILSVAKAGHLDIAEPKKKLEPAYQALSTVLAGSPVDVTAALEKLDGVLDLERTIKRRHLYV